MELSELAAYAQDKYHIREEHKWAEFPGFPKDREVGRSFDAPMGL